MSVNPQKPVDKLLALASDPDYRRTRWGRVLCALVILNELGMRTWVCVTTGTLQDPGVLGFSLIVISLLLNALALRKPPASPAPPVEGA